LVMYELIICFFRRTDNASVHKLKCIWIMRYLGSCGLCRRFVSRCWVVPTLQNNTYALHGHCSWIYFLQVKCLICSVAKGWKVIYHMCKNTTRSVKNTSVYQIFVLFMSYYCAFVLQ
jgi:hypothetical protein